MITPGTFNTSFRVPALRRGIVSLFEPSGGEDSVADDAIRQMAWVEMLNLGFKVDVNSLKGFACEELEDMLAAAREAIGADRDMTPIYPGFPQQVQSMDTLTLLTEQILHYLTLGAFLPNYPDVAREGLPLADMLRDLREVKVMTVDEAALMFVRDLTTQTIALSDNDKNLLGASNLLAMTSLNDAASIVKEAKNGENIQTLVAAMAHAEVASRDAIARAIIPRLSNADQILRVVLVLFGAQADTTRDTAFQRAVFTLSNKDATSVRFLTMGRNTRRVLLERLGQVTEGYYADSLVARSNLWRRVMRMVHPYSMSAAKDGSVKRALDIIHANVEYRTLNSAVEKAMADGDVITAVALLSTYQPGNLLRRVVALLRLSDTFGQVFALSDGLRKVGSKAAISTLVSAYNGVLSANDDRNRVIRVAGRNNSVQDRTMVKKVDPEFLSLVTAALEDALTQALKRTPAPEGQVGVLGEAPMPLVRRDLSTTDRAMDRGQEIAMVGEGDTIRLFGHWVNNQSTSGYMDIGAYVLDSTCESLTVATWNSWEGNRDWATYSGDKLVEPGGSAAEYFDVDVAALKRGRPTARYVALTIVSYSGFPMNEVDMIAGAMLRSKPNSGEPFDARTVASAFAPTTTSFNAVPLVIDLETGKMVWVDTSNGSTRTGMSVASDDTIGDLIYDELVRPRMSIGKFASLWAKAHNAETNQQEQASVDTLLTLL